ncbi:MAG: 3-keto-disaccharide hydrolase [Verrucomicrobiales bacterium]
MKTITCLLASTFLLALLPSMAAEPVKLFDGTNVDEWEVKEKKKGENRWVVGEPKVEGDAKSFVVTAEGDGAGRAMVNKVDGHGQSWDIYSKKKFGSCRIEIEFMVAKGANSGVYVMGEYEVQILDSFGKEKMGNGDMGAIYGAKPASANPCKKHGEWQKYVIDFQAPRFDEDGKKIANAKFIKVELNGTVIQEGIEMPGPTPSGVTGKEAAEGPVMFQGDHGPVAFRNVKVTPMEFD